MVNRIAATLAASVLLMSIGIAHGVRTDRFVAPTDILAVADRLKSVPLIIDGWKGTEQKIDPRQINNAGALGYVARVYQGPGQKSVGVTILCGRHGPIATHEPTVCFVNTGMRQLHNEKTTEFAHGAEQSTFMETDFALPTPGEQTQRTYWGWSKDARSWSTPQNPRVEFAGEPYLYKIYFLTPIDSSEDGERQELDSEISKFMSSFLTELPGFLKPAPAAQ